MNQYSWTQIKSIMKIFAIMQRDWARYYGLPLMESIKKEYPKCSIDTLAYKISTYNLIKDRKDLFNNVWLGYKYDDNIYNKNIKKIRENINRWNRKDTSNW